MKFTKYVTDKINEILGFVVYCITIAVYLMVLQVDKSMIFILILISCLFFVTGFLVVFWKKNRYIQEIEMVMEHLQEKYLLSEVIKKPRREENLAYYRILKKVNQSMLENVTKLRKAQKDYKEYIESWVHEIKIPITSSKLLCENHKSEETEKLEEEIEKINNFVEQALFYARLDYVSNDFMIRKVNLGEIVRMVLAKNKKIMIQKQMKVEVEEAEVSAYTDEKWLEFMINQIMINSIKYKKETGSEIRVRYAGE